MLDGERLFAALFDGDDVTHPYLVRGDIDFLAIHEKVAVVHELTCLRAGSGEPGAIDDVVKARLEDLEKGGAGDLAAAVGLFVIAAKLLLENSVDVTQLLLLTKLDEVLRFPNPATTVIPGRVRAAVEILRLVLVEELPRAAAHLGAGSCVTSHL
jgi:hypothetical protein